MVFAPVPAVLLALSALVACVAAQSRGFMPDLGYPEPDWKVYTESSHNLSVITPELMDQSRLVWGTNRPGIPSGQPLCQHTAGAQNNGRGVCRTDFSWLAASLGVEMSAFSDPFVNWFMRYQVYGACYRSTQYSFNNEAAYCAQWWLDPITQTKINVTNFCYDIIQEDPSRVNLDGTVYRYKWGCAHLLPGTPPPYVPPTVVGGGGTGVSTSVSGRRLQQSFSVPGAPATGAATPAAPSTPAAPATPAASTPVAPAAPVASTPVATPAAGSPAAGGATVGPAAPVTPPANATAPPATSAANSTGVAPGTTCAPTTFASGQDFIRSGQLFVNGLEKWDVRQAWYDCQQTTPDGSPARIICQEEAIGLNYGVNVRKLKTLMDLYAGIQGLCNEFFAANAASQPANVTDKAWCEADTNNWIIQQYLPTSLGLEGTPAQPACMAPVVTPPPPPSPPPPPPPPAPPSPPPIGISNTGDTLFGATTAAVQTPDVAQSAVAEEAAATDAGEPSSSIRLYAATSVGTVALLALLIL